MRHKNTLIFLRATRKWQLSSWFCTDCELKMPPLVLQLVLVRPGASTHKSLWPWLNPSSKNRVASSNDISFSQVVFWQSCLGQCTTSAKYILAKLNDWLTPTSNCFHVCPLFDCTLYMCQVRHEMTNRSQMPNYPENNFLSAFLYVFFTWLGLRTDSNQSVLHLSNMFSLLTLFSRLSSSLSWCLRFRLSQKVQAHFHKQLVNSESKWRMKALWFAFAPLENDKFHHGFVQIVN